MNSKDWVTKAARYIKTEPSGATEERIAAVIATFAKPLVDLLLESRRDDHEEGCSAGWAQVGVIYDDQRCSCASGTWNARIDAVLGDVSSERAPIDLDALTTEMPTVTTIELPQIELSKLTGGDADYDAAVAVMKRGEPFTFSGEFVSNEVADTQLVLMRYMEVGQRLNMTADVDATHEMVVEFAVTSKAVREKALTGPSGQPNDGSDKNTRNS